MKHLGDDFLETLLFFLIFDFIVVLIPMFVIVFGWKILKIAYKILIELI